MKFSAPVVYTTTGWVEIEADNLQDAQGKAKRMNEDGIAYDIIQDGTDESEVMLNELVPLEDT